MLKLKKLHLQNYTGYRNVIFDFTRRNGLIKPISVFFGPNGCGKSTCLHAIDLLGRAKQYQGRENDLLFRKMIYHQDYDPTLPHFMSSESEMRLVGTFDQCGEEKIVEVTSSQKDSTDGIVRNDLHGLRNESNQVVGMVYIDADHPMTMQKFQLPAERAEAFIDIAETVYAYKVDLGKPVMAHRS